jgi:hypothetical protein
MIHRDLTVIIKQGVTRETERKLRKIFLKQMKIEADLPKLVCYIKINMNREDGNNQQVL